MTVMITSEIWDFHKRKADTVGLNEGGRAEIYVLNNIEINDRIDKSIIKPTFEPSDGRNKNSDIMSIRTPFELLSKQVLTFPGLGGHNSKRETQNERSD